jgi:CheY-like chemotaxis protein
MKLKQFLGSRSRGPPLSAESLHTRERIPLRHNRCAPIAGAAPNIGRRREHEQWSLWARHPACGPKDPAEALDVLKSDEQIDVLLTDVRMLGRMNGFELAEIAKRRRPELRVIVTSGYSARGDLPSGKVPTQRVFGIRSREPSETGGCLNGHQSSRALCQSASAPGM